MGSTVAIAAIGIVSRVGGSKSLRCHLDAIQSRRIAFREDLDPGAELLAVLINPEIALGHQADPASPARADVCQRAWRRPERASNPPWRARGDGS